MLPAEAEAMIKAGRAKELMKDWWESDSRTGNDSRVYVLAPAIEGYQGEQAPEWGGGRCSLLKEGLCQLHDTGYKPAECRGDLACGEKQKHLPRLKIAPHWMEPAAENIIAMWDELMAKQEAA